MRVFNSPAELDSAVKAGFRFLPEYGPAAFYCMTCRHDKPLNMTGSGGTGYGVSPSGNAFHCYTCCAKTERDSMLRNGNATLYLSQETGKPARITDWPGELAFSVTEIRKFRHPFARSAYCGTFRGPDGMVWRFKNIGDSQIAHCKRAA